MQENRELKINVKFWCSLVSFKSITDHIFSSKVAQNDDAGNFNANQIKDITGIKLNTHLLKRLD